MAKVFVPSHVEGIEAMTTALQWESHASTPQLPQLYILCSFAVAYARDSVHNVTRHAPRLRFILSEVLPVCHHRCLTAQCQLEKGTQHYCLPGFAVMVEGKRVLRNVMGGVT